uniref:ribonuclease P protein component n=1 Tax=Nocardioides terrisoli TaxID=3388267 RepID=UPI0037C74ACE
MVRRGTRAGGPVLVLHLRDTDEQRPVQVGLVVSKAVGPAVTRNLVKRRLRHLMRDRIADLPPGSLLVVRAQPAAAGASYAELGAELDRGLARLTGQRGEHAGRVGP